MNRTVLLSNGYHMPILGLGTWKAEPGAVEQAVNWALETGYRLIDTAYSYGNEEAIGKTLTTWMGNGGKREDLFITTKLPNFGNRPNEVSKYLKESLKRLNLKYVDLYLVHHPFGFLQPANGTPPPLIDMTTDHLGVWKEMEEAVKAGLTRSIGLSNFNAKQVEKIVAGAKIKPVNLQVELHAYLQQPELVKTCKELGLSVTAYAPIGSPGALDHFRSKYNFDVKDIPICLNDPDVQQIAEKLGVTSAQVLLRFLIEQDIAVVPKSSSKERILENYKALSFSLGEEYMKKLKALDKGAEGRIFDFLFYKGIEKHPEYPFSEERKT